MIAISYRREDSISIAGRLYDRLQGEFGKGNVFMDFDSIPYGVDFREHIKESLSRAKVLIAVIGPQWSGTISDSNRRIDDPADFVRLEISSALERRIPVIPVLVNKTQMPTASELPTELQPIAFRNALSLDSGVDFHHHIDRLIAGIHELIEPKRRTPEPARPALKAGARKPRTSAARDKAGQRRSSTVDAASTAPREEVRDEPTALPESPPVSTPTAKPVAVRVSPSTTPDGDEPGEKFSWGNDWRKGTVILASGILLLVVLIALLVRLFRAPEPAVTAKPAIGTVPVRTPEPARTTPPPAPVAVNSSTPVPMAQSGVAATPNSVPSASPPFLLTENEAAGFVRSFYYAIEKKDLPRLLGYYDETVDYLSHGRKDKAAMSDEYRKYFQAWSFSTYTPQEIGIRPAGANAAGLSFYVKFFMLVPPDNHKVSGRALEEWIVTKADNSFKISSQQETLFPDVSATPAADEQVVRTFVIDYYAAMARHDLSALLAKFGDPVDYQGEGTRSRSYIQRDLTNYFSKWPRLGFQVEPVNVTRAGDDRFNVSFGVNYEAANAKGRTSGHAAENWVLRNVNGALLIVSQQESVQSNGKHRR